MNDKPLRLVGYLQKVSDLPLVAVYMDSDSEALYVFVRVNNPGESKPIYVATDITADVLEKYLNRRIVLRTMFARKTLEYAEVVNGRIRKIDDADCLNAEIRLKKAGRFEPELCVNKIEIEHFIYNLNRQ